ncbi:MAG: hypothetical protein RMK29_02835 [Myxococcales bacterium]|nr:hypothetical protein [Myxococcales bacterium]
MLVRSLLLCLPLALAGCGKTPSLTGENSPGGVPSPCTEDPGVEGRRRVTRFALDIPLRGGLSRLQTTVFGPSEDGERISPEGAPFPLVIFSPAAGVSRDQYFDYAFRLANHGMVAVVQSPRAEWDHRLYRDDTLGLLNWLTAPTGADADQVRGRVDPARVGLTGHGLGGKVAFLAAGEESRVRAVFGIDPVNTLGASMDNPSVLPILPRLRSRSGLLGQRRSADIMPSCTPATENYEVFFAALPSPTFAITFLTAGHMDFVDDLARCNECTRCGSGAMDQHAVHALSVKYTTAFFQVHLQGCTGLQGHLTGAAFQRDAATGLVSVRSK